MKKVIGFILFITVICIAAAWFGVNATAPMLSQVKKDIAPVAQEGVQEPSTPSPANPGSPQRIAIPKISVDAAVESVGLDRERKMDVPKRAENVGWYNLGVKPGEIGNAVMAGHFDGPDGSPAVFYEVTELVPGDTILVTDDKGTTYTYVVKDKQLYEFDKLPLQDIFGKYSKARLNLITCDGTFDKGAKNYSHRAVIYAELQAT